MRIILTILIAFSFTTGSYAQDTTYLLKVHFLYGSKPAKKYRDTERKWFGGKLGGHVGIEINPDEILNFVPNGKFHVFGKKYNRHSAFAIHSVTGFYSIFGGHPDSVKKAIFYVPVTAQQKSRADSISVSYRQQTPYDYAFFGMRCGAAAYDILAQLEVVKEYKITKTSWKIFYPKKVRKRLLKKAKTNAWKVEITKGSTRRKWEKD